MALDRQAVQKQDFPLSRRGFDPAAVGAHLAALASALEELQDELEQARGAAAPAPSLAGAASEQVRAIVEAAERSGAEIQRSATEQAQQVRADADAQARRVRDDAVERSTEHVERVGVAAGALQQRLGAMADELAALFAGLRAGAERLTTDLIALQETLDELHGPPSATAASPSAAIEPVPAAVRAASTDPVAGSEGERLAQPVAAASPRAGEPSSGEAAGRDADADNARLTAFSMVLGGQTRADIDRFLGETYVLADRAGLLDEVFAAAER